ncbi:Vacuolar protein sorting-associated protein 26 [Friedmanniomyces endolithicus]|nr:Vacuolar protein sorting-associated protein 26 [Friedmanniomyces endolithicus]
MSLFSFGTPLDIDIVLQDTDERSTVDVKLDKTRKEKAPLYLDGETVKGAVTIRPKDGKRLEHTGIKVQFVGTIEMFFDRGTHHEFLSLQTELASPGELQHPVTLPFAFKNVEKQYESYHGINVKLRYFLRVTVSRRMADVVREKDLWVYSYRQPPESNSVIKMDVGIEDCLHIEFEYSKSKYHLKDVIVGRIYFLLVRLKIRHMDLSIIRRETTGVPPNQYNESETLVRFEIMDGSPSRGETIPIRLFLGGFDLTPTFRDVNKKFSTRYYLSLVLIDEDARSNGANGDGVGEHAVNGLAGTGLGISNISHGITTSIGTFDLPHNDNGPQFGEGLESSVDGKIVNGVRQSGVQSEAVREKGDWDELFLECSKKTLKDTQHAPSKAHRRNASAATLMLTPKEFRSLLQQRGTLVVDGALATELETKGLDLNHPLWSGKALRDNPTTIQVVHLDYYLAGADIAITSSYQTSTQGLKDHLSIDEKEAMDLVRKSVKLAQEARREAYETGKIEEGRKLLVAGSIGPYGAYLSDGSEYRGDYQRTVHEFQTFHRPRIAALVDQGADLLAIETMPSLPEIEAVIALLKSDFPTAIAWISCTLRDAEHLSDGTRMVDVLRLAAGSEQIVAFGVNCVPMRLCTAALQNLQACLVDLPAPSNAFPLLCYPNSGEIWDAETKTWRGERGAAENELATRVAYWRDAGARLIGGCCRAGPKDVAEIARALRDG